MGLLNQRGKSIYLIHILFIAALFCITLGFFVSSSLEGILNNSEAEAQKHENLINQIKLVSTLVVDAETGERGYLITRDDALLAPYEKARTSLENELQSLQEQVNDDPIQATNFNRLKEAVEKRMEELATTIQEQQKSINFRVSNQKILQHAETMEQIRSAAEEMISREQAGLKQALQAIKEDQKRQDQSLQAGALISSMGLILFYIVVIRQWSQLYNSNLQKEIASDVTLGATDKDTLATRCKLIMQSIRKRVAYDMGAFYLLDQNNLRLIATYGTHGEIPETLPVGQGLLGEFLQSRDVSICNDLPSHTAKEDVIKTSSTFSQATPLKLAFLPIWIDNEPFGILELGRFSQKFSRGDGLVLESSIYPIGRSLDSLRFREKLRSLLAESEEQRQRLHNQQEELRASNEELEQQTEALKRAKGQLQDQQEKLQQSNEELEQQTANIELQKEMVDMRNRELTKAKKDLEENHHKLEQISRYKSEFLANMSHELRTPLNSLLILSGLLKANKDQNLNDEQVEFASIINKSGADLLNLINDILDLSKIEAGKMAVNLKETSPHNIAQDMRYQFLAQAKEKGLGFSIDVEDGLTNFVTDSQRLEQILKNFLSNAFKFTHHGSVELVIRRIEPNEQKDTNPENLGICFQVKDTGIGIAPEKLEKIFDAFEQADSAIDRQFGGTGLGLTISEQLAQKLGGHIEVKSVPEQGSTFTLYLPKAMNPEARPTESFVTHTEKQSLERESDLKVISTLGKTEPFEDENTILIIEDDETFAQTLSTEAKTRGYSVLLASDMHSAISHLKSGRPKAIILDIRLPDGNGLILLDKIKQNSDLRTIPIHIVSAFDYRQNALRLGALGYCTKPLNLNTMGQMFDRIESVIKRPVKSILVVEDDLIQQKALQQLLKQKDVNILFAATGDEAKAMLHRETLDCMILDLSLPDTNGIDLLESIEGDDSISRPPVIVYTGQDLDKDLEERLRKFSDSIVIKSSRSPERLRREVSLFLHRVETQPDQESRFSELTEGKESSTFEGKNVLIVDDDLRNTFALTAVLEPLGFGVNVARDGVEALKALETNENIDVVLMDIMMPKMDGIEATTRIRANQRHRDLPIVALTAKAMKGDRERCLEAGASDYLTKPIDVEKLISTLNIWVH